MSQHDPAADIGALTDAQLFKRLYRLQIEALVRKLAAGESITAAELNVARQTLADNGVNRTTLGTLDTASALRDLAGQLPEFEDGPE